MKRLLSLSACLMIALLSFAHDFEKDGIYYDITSTTEPYTVEVTYRGTSSSDYSNEYTGSVTIPETVDYSGKTYNVTSIGESAFYGCTGLTSVTIPNSVTSIGSSAFGGCSGLTSVTIPNSVTSIDNQAFYGTAWYDNQPDGLVYAGKVAYKYKGTMPANTSITLDEGTLGIAGCAFYDCSGLTSVTIPNSVTSIGSSAFDNCRGLTSVTIPNSVTSIGSSAFGYCRGLTSITIPNSVTSIGLGAFYECSGLTSVTIPNSVTSIGSEAFSGTAWYDNQPDGLVYAGKVAYKYKGTMPANTSITLDEGTLGIAGSAFSGCSGLTSVTIPNSVTSIGEEAFRNCTGLTSITIGNSVKNIGDGAFYDCSGLTSVTIPNSVTSIGMNAFYKCSGLKSVTIPNSVTSIGFFAFQGCSGLTEITSNIQEPFATANCWYGVDKSIPLYVPAGTKEEYQSTGGWKDFTNIIEMEETTGIESLSSDSSAKGEESGNIYSLDGRKVSNSGLPKGIYIKNGKKVVIK